MLPGLMALRLVEADELAYHVAHGRLVVDCEWCGLPMRLSSGTPAVRFVGSPIAVFLHAGPCRAAVPYVN